MKQALIILLITTYALSSFGVSVNGFYCCGKLTSVSLSLADVAKEISGKYNSKDDCCKTKSQYYKVSDSHLLAADVAIAPACQVADIHIRSTGANTTAFSSIKRELINGSHAPPLYTGVPVYISHCIFRI